MAHGLPMGEFCSMIFCVFMYLRIVSPAPCSGCECHTILICFFKTLKKQLWKMSTNAHLCYHSRPTPPSLQPVPLLRHCISTALSLMKRSDTTHKLNTHAGINMSSLHTKFFIGRNLGPVETRVNLCSKQYTGLWRHHTVHSIHLCIVGIR